MHLGNDVTWFLPDTDPSTPDGLSKAFRVGADVCLRGAKELNSDLADTQILTCHAMELALKAFLAKRGLNAAKLRNKPYGHDLDRLYHEAVKHGLSLSPMNERVIQAINEYHRKNLIRYEFDKTRTMPVCEGIFPIIETIIKAV